MARYSTRFERDYAFYLRNRGVFTFSGRNKPAICGVRHDEKGQSAKECFYSFDSTGHFGPCNQPELLLELLICKAAVNLQIKQWAGGLRDGTLNPDELLTWVDDYHAPGWVLHAVIKMSRKW